MTNIATATGTNNQPDFVGRVQIISISDGKKSCKSRAASAPKMDTKGDFAPHT